MSLFNHPDIIEFKNTKWHIISRSKVMKDDEQVDTFIVALSGKRCLSYLESNMAAYHIDQWNTFHNKL